MRPGTPPATGGSAAPSVGPLGGGGASIGGAAGGVGTSTGGWEAYGPPTHAASAGILAHWGSNGLVGGPCQYGPPWHAGEPRHLRASGIKRVGGNVGARVGIVKWSRRSGRAYEAGRCVRRNGHTRHGYCDKCTAHGYFRHRAADTRGHRPVHPSLLWSGRKRATLPFTVIAATNAYGRMHASRRRVKQVWCSWVRFSTGLFRGNLNARSFLRCSGPACLAYACDQGSP